MRSTVLLMIAISTTLLCGCLGFYGVEARVERDHSVETVAIGSCGPTPCVKVTIETIPELHALFSEEARTKASRVIDQSLYAPLDGSDGDASASSLVASVKALYEDFENVRDSSRVKGWSVERVASLVYTNGELVSVAVTNQGFLGGAHGFNEQRLFVFDAKTGNVLGWDDVIASGSQAIFLKAAEAEFKRARGLPADRPLTEEGFMFDNGESFQLPTNFALTDKGIICHYNPYEVGPYVLGSTDFTVPLEATRPAFTALATSLLRVSEPRKGLL